jgi:hypothetical protein
VWTLFLLVTLGIMTLNSMLPFFLESALRLPGEAQTLVLGTLFGTAVLSFPAVGRGSAPASASAARSRSACCCWPARCWRSWRRRRPGVVGAHLLTLTVLAGIGLAAVMMLPWAMLPDVVEFDALAHGRRREGLLYALFTFGQKVAGLVGVFANALAASVFGYVQGSALQAPHTVDGIRLMTGPCRRRCSWWRPPGCGPTRSPRERHAEAQAALAGGGRRGARPDGAATAVGAAGAATPVAAGPAAVASGMRELLYEAAKHYRRGKALADRGDARGASVAFEDALRELRRCVRSGCATSCWRRCTCRATSSTSTPGRAPPTCGSATPTRAPPPNRTSGPSPSACGAVAVAPAPLALPPARGPPEGARRGRAATVRPRQDARRDRRTGRDRRAGAGAGRGPRDGGGPSAGDRARGDRPNPVEPGLD